MCRLVGAAGLALPLGASVRYDHAFWIDRHVRSHDGAASLHRRVSSKVDNHSCSLCSCRRLFRRLALDSLSAVAISAPDSTAGTLKALAAWWPAALFSFDAATERGEQRGLVSQLEPCGPYFHLPAQAAIH
jgi:hypothetical protein